MEAVTGVVEGKGENMEKPILVGGCRLGVEAATGTTDGDGYVESWTSRRN